MKEIIADTLNHNYVSSLTSAEIKYVISLLISRDQKKKLHVSIGNRFKNASEFGDKNFVQVFIEDKQVFDNGITLLIGDYEIYQYKLPFGADNMIESNFFSNKDLLAIQNMLFATKKDYKTNWRRFYISQENINFVQKAETATREEYLELERKHDKAVSDIYYHADHDLSDHTPLFHI